MSLPPACATLYSNVFSHAMPVHDRTRASDQAHGIRSPYPDVAGDCWWWHQLELGSQTSSSPEGASPTTDEESLQSCFLGDVLATTVGVAEDTMPMHASSSPTRDAKSDQTISALLSTAPWAFTNDPAWFSEPLSVAQPRAPSRPLPAGGTAYGPSTHFFSSSAQMALPSTTGPPTVPSLCFSPLVPDPRWQFAPDPIPGLENAVGAPGTRVLSSRGLEGTAGAFASAPPSSCSSERLETSTPSDIDIATTIGALSIATSVSVPFATSSGTAPQPGCPSAPNPHPLARSPPTLPDTAEKFDISPLSPTSSFASSSYSASPLPSSSSSSSPSPSEKRQIVRASRSRNVQIRHMPYQRPKLNPLSMDRECKFCGRVLKGRSGDFVAHVKTHFREQGEPEWVCCGIPVEDVTVDFSRRAQVPAEEIYRGRRMVGGCGRDFACKFSLGRHLRTSKKNCIGDVHAPYIYGNVLRALEARQ